MLSKLLEEIPRPAIKSQTIFYDRLHYWQCSLFPIFRITCFSESNPPSMDSRKKLFLNIVQSLVIKDYRG